MNARTEHRAALAPLVESGADTWRTPDGRFTLVFSEVEPDTYVYLLHDLRRAPSDNPVRCLTEYSAAATVRARIAAEKPRITEAQRERGVRLFRLCVERAEKDITPDVFAFLPRHVRAALVARQILTLVDHQDDTTTDQRVRELVLSLNTMLTEWENSL